MELLALSYLLIFFIAAAALLLLGRIIEKRMMRERRRWVRLLVIIPQGIAMPLTEHRPHEIALSVDLYKRLHEHGIDFTLETAVHAIGEEIHFYICTRAASTPLTTRLIESLWHASYVTPVDEYDLWSAGMTNENGRWAIGHLTQDRPYCIPLKTSQKGKFEPFSGILRHLSELETVGEAAAIQWVVRPADPRLMHDAAKHLERFGRGEYHPSRHVHEEFILTPATIKTLEEKIRSPLFVVNARLVAATTTGNAHRILRDLASHFVAGSMTSTNHNSFKLVEAKHPEKALEAFFARRFEPAQEMVLTAEEIATYFHLPGASTALPKSKR
jgi:hypothetical protein